MPLFSPSHEILLACSQVASEGSAGESEAHVQAFLSHLRRRFQSSAELRRASSQEARQHLPSNQSNGTVQPVEGCVTLNKLYKYYWCFRQWHSQRIRKTIKLAFRRSLLACVPTVDLSFATRFADFKLLAPCDILFIFINSRRNPGSDDMLQVLTYLVECLQSYPGCFGVWRQMYAEQGAHKEQSAMLLRHMMARWSSVWRQIDISALRETLLTFRDINERDPRRNEDATRAVNVRSSLLSSKS